MELVEPIERINETLQRQYGSHDDGRPRFRVVWSEDQIEKRWTKYTKEGLELLNPEVVELKKYQHIKERYVLEQLSVVPDTPDNDLTVKLSYEPLWTFQDRHEDYLPPRAEVCILIINEIYDAMDRKARGISRVMKEDPDKAAKELARVEEMLFGNETRVTDDLGLGIAVTDFNQKVQFTNEVKDNAGNV